MKLRDIHIKVSEVDYERLIRLCLHKGDLTFILQQAVKKYLDMREVRKAGGGTIGERVFGEDEGPHVDV